MSPNAKLFLIARADLAPGAQLAQACHALRAFTATHPAVDAEWYRDSNNLVVLQVPDEPALAALTERAHAAAVPHAVFREFDFGNEATALALAPSGARLVSQLPLALRALVTERAA